MAYVLYSVLTTTCIPVFGICIAILYGVSYITGWSYEETSVYINIYFQGFLVAASSLFVLFGVLKSSKWYKVVLSIMYVIANFGFYAMILQHYGFDTAAAFDKCYHELMDISYAIVMNCGLSDYGNGIDPGWIEYCAGPTIGVYMIINVLFFVFTFITVICLNYFIGKKCKRQKTLVYNKSI